MLGHRVQARVEMRRDLGNAGRPFLRQKRQNGAPRRAGRRLQNVRQPAGAWLFNHGVEFHPRIVSVSPLEK